MAPVGVVKVVLLIQPSPNTLTDGPAVVVAINSLDVAPPAMTLITSLLFKAVVE